MECPQKLRNQRFWIVLRFTEAAFLDLHLSFSYDIISTKIYDKSAVFDLEIVNFPFLDGDVPRSTSYVVYISQLIHFARASRHVTAFNTRNKLLTKILLKQGYWYYKLRTTFSKFYQGYYNLISKFQVGLRYILCQGLSEPEFYKTNVLQQTACLVVNQSWLRTLLSSLITRRWVGLQTQDGFDLKTYLLMRW